MSAPTITSKYTLLRRLGQGGMAEVYLARQTGLRGFAKLVVLKRILPQKAQNGDFVTMFLDEARIAADLRHPNIVNVFDINRADGTYYMAMEFLHGIDVRDLLKTTFGRRQRVPIGVSAHIAAAAASGLHYAHNKKTIDGIALNIVHRDISPQNIILGFSGETKIVDFGIAKADRQVFETQVGRLKGKYAYMSPEHARGEKLDGRADQYALAVVLWEMLTSRRLFRGKNVQATLQRVLNASIESPRKLVPEIPRSIDTVVMKALSKDREKRFADCDGFRVALEDALAAAKIPNSTTRLQRYLREVFDEPEGEGSLSAEHLTLEDVGSAPKKIKRMPKVRVDVANPNTQESEAVRQVTPSQIFGGESQEEARDTVYDPRPPEAFVDDKTATLAGPVHTAVDGAVAPEPQSGVTARRMLMLGVFGGAAFGLTLGIGYAIGRVPGVLTEEKSVIVVRTTPPGATAVVDGEEMAERTPLVLRRPPGSVVRLELVVVGRQPLTKVVTAPAAGQPPLELNLALKGKP